jgi:hypothetical protein
MSKSHKKKLLNSLGITQFIFFKVKYKLYKSAKENGILLYGFAGNLGSRKKL